MIVLIIGPVEPNGHKAAFWSGMPGSQLAQKFTRTMRPRRGRPCNLPRQCLSSFVNGLSVISKKVSRSSRSYISCARFLSRGGKHSAESHALVKEVLDCMRTCSCRWSLFEVIKSVLGVHLRAWIKVKNCERIARGEGKKRVSDNVGTCDFLWLKKNPLTICSAD